MEVVKQSKVERVDICDDVCHYGYEPQSTLELKEPGRFSLESLVGRLSGKAALHKFQKGDLVAVRLLLRKNKKNDEYVNQVTFDDIKLVKELDHLFL